MQCSNDSHSHSELCESRRAVYGRYPVRVRRKAAVTLADELAPSRQVFVTFEQVYDTIANHGIA
jgi:hypothetical protein